MGRETWQRGLEDELGFWRGVMRTGGDYPDDWRARLDPKTPLLPHLAALVPEGGAVLDVGAGPLTILGTAGVHAGAHTIRAVDILGDRYARELAAAGVVPLVPTEACDAEDLTRTVGRDAYDLVYCRNALDHTWDALSCLRQMAAACKPGGYIVLEHHENESSTQGGKGLHAWDFSMVGSQPTARRLGEPLIALGLALASSDVKLVDFSREAGWLRWVFRRGALAGERLIPKIIHQIWIGPKRPPERLLCTWKTLYLAAGWQYRLWCLESDSWLYQREIDLQRELNGKADIMRYELLFQHGGVCVDADSEALAILPEDLLRAEAFASWENENKLPGMVATGTIGARRGAAVLHDVLHRIRSASWGAPQLWAKMPAWRSVGPEVWTATVREHPEVVIHPAAYFLPEHYSKVPPAPADRGPFARQYWGSTMLSPHYGYAGLT